MFSDRTRSTPCSIRWTWAYERVFSDRDQYYGEPHTKEVFWLEVCRYPYLLDAVEAVLGPNLILVYSSMFIKLPDDGTSVGWHQDNNYWPSVHGTDVATVWLALDDADAENAAMRIIPGSHRDYREMETVPAEETEMLRKKVQVAPEMEAQAVMMEMKAGSLSIHDSYILHGSEANESGPPPRWHIRFATVAQTRLGWTWTCIRFRCF